ncbi:hypothetical protein WUBG_08390 [Wuchereria bancrofti]|uniref:Uncharacterized protein n=1 Tax=Wuchereria bancrofti TaxID=6293 RepID=J9EUA1_WUCBA|nr:hypothetical protein WUBG_08390 [Wuchereria bancrofti]
MPVERKGMTYLTSPTSLYGISQSFDEAEIRSTTDISRQDNCGTESRSPITSRNNQHPPVHPNTPLPCYQMLSSPHPNPHNFSPRSKLTRVFEDDVLCQITDFYGVQ